MLVSVVETAYNFATPLLMMTPAPWSPWLALS